MRNYSLATIARIGDIGRGVHVKTGVLLNTLIFDHNPALAVDLFTVYGRIRIIGLNCEAVTAFAANASLLKWEFRSTTPVVGVSDISAVSLTVQSIPIGARVMWRGTAVNTAPDVSATQASIAVVTDYMDVGVTGGVGVIDSLCTTATQASGTCQMNLYYFAISQGAYVEALL
jgi:hypothetical protein